MGVPGDRARALVWSRFDTKDGIVHELVWAPLVLALFALARLLPERVFPPCPFRALTSFPCLSCGGTRAIRALVHLDFITAFAMNPLAAAAALLGLAYVVHALLVALGASAVWRPDPSRLFTPFFRAACLLALAANWFYLVAAGR